MPADEAVTDRLRLIGIGIGTGAAIAPAHVMGPAPVAPVSEPPAADPQAAGDHVASIIADVAEALLVRSGQVEEPLSSVLEATAMMAGDPTLEADMRSRIAKDIGPATAVAQAFDAVIEQFTALGGYMAERATDLRGVRARVLGLLLSLPDPEPLTGRSILVAGDLSPTETSALDLELVAGIVLAEGGPTGHTAIIARQAGIPCVVRAGGAAQLTQGTTVLVDAASGTVIENPSADERDALRRVRVMEDQLAEDQDPGATSDGHRIELLANIGAVDDARTAVLRGAEGVGLFRTELLFLGREQAPSVREQTDLYLAAVEAFGGRKTIVRTLDIGADKPVPFLPLDPEENPALGVRGYRLVRQAHEVLDDQLRALAAVDEEMATPGPWVMAPMISTAHEARGFATSARAHGIDRVGVMIEVPAAAICIADILAEVDFVSIGTNDLAQYTMGADRMQGALADLLSPWQPAVLELISRVAAEGVSTGKPVGVCGESAADPLMALVLTGFGVTSLSMAPAAIPAVRHAIRAHSLRECRELASLALSMPDAASAAQAVAHNISPRVRELLAL